MSHSGLPIMSGVWYPVAPSMLTMKSQPLITTVQFVTHVAWFGADARK